MKYAILSDAVSAAGFISKRCPRQVLPVPLGSHATDFSKQLIKVRKFSYVNASHARARERRHSNIANLRTRSLSRESKIKHNRELWLSRENGERNTHTGRFPSWKFTAAGEKQSPTRYFKRQNKIQHGISARIHNLSQRKEQTKRKLRISKRGLTAHFTAE